MAGRPRKPSRIRELEGNRQRTEIPADLPLAGFPEAPEHLSARGREHFNFVSAELSAIGVTKRLDTEALSIMADLWDQYWHWSEQRDVSKMTRIISRWMVLAGRFGLTPADRAKLMAPQTVRADPVRDKFLKIVTA